MATRFGSGGDIELGGFTMATVRTPGPYGEEVPVADITPISQSTGARVKSVGLVKSTDDSVFTGLFDLATTSLPTGGSAQTLTHYFGASATRAQVLGKAFCSRFEINDQSHEDEIEAVVTCVWQGGATGTNEPVWTKES